MIMRQLTLFLLPILFCWTIAAYGENDVIIDVRTLEEWHAGHLESATHIELQYVAQSIEAVVPNKDQKVYLYCRSGNRSGKAKDILEALGYSNVVNAGGVAQASADLQVDIVR